VITRSIPAGTYALYIREKGKDPAIISSDFTVKAPEIYSVSPPEASPGEIITVRGKYFGLSPSISLTGADNRKIGFTIMKPFKYPNWKGSYGKSTMDTSTGESEILFSAGRRLEQQETATFSISSKTGDASSQFNKPRKKWSFLFYMNADNDLEADLLNEFLLISSVGSGNDIDLIVQLDRAKDSKNGFGNWTITHRFYVEKGMEPLPANAIQDWNDGKGGGREVDMTDPGSLTSFISWALQRYPAKNNVLVVVDHGYGWRGLSIDETSNSKHMTLRGFKQGIEDSAADINLILFDACLMQSMEVVYELRHCGAEYIVGSQAPASPVMPFDKILTDLGENPEWSLLELAKDINDRYAEKNSEGIYYTHSTVRLDAVEGMADAYLNFTKAIIEEEGFSSIQSKAAAAIEALQNAVAYNRCGNQAAGSGGIGIYFPKALPVTLPQAPDEVRDFYMGNIVEFASDSCWNLFLYGFTAPGIPPFPIDPRIHNARDSVTNVYSNNIVDVYGFLNEIVNPDE